MSVSVAVEIVVGFARDEMKLSKLCLRGRVLRVEQRMAGSRSSAEVDGERSGTMDTMREEELGGGGSGYEAVAGLSVEEFCRKVFSTEEEAYEMYKMFGRCNEFGICKGDYCKDEG
ncbi:hypothetical protein PIB30_101608 [Stylosanthes scabra]|uniref:Uncharacterized protein n=1 Tax=Stylosanthes scabra TaxID=79078 RepID=A0ABU6WXG3_9FABA|nr:hypothetical protein [Stylosanthes scabra]